MFEEQHTRAWNMVKQHMMANLRVFAGRSSEGVSVLMPELTSWVNETLQDCSDIREVNDHMLVFWFNLPTAGIVSATKNDFFLSLATNKLAEHRRNGVAIFTHTNRAAQIAGAVDRSGVQKWLDR